MLWSELIFNKERSNPTCISDPIPLSASDVSTFPSRKHYWNSFEIWVLNFSSSFADLASASPLRTGPNWVAPRHNSIALLRCHRCPSRHRPGSRHTDQGHTGSAHLPRYRCRTHAGLPSFLEADGIRATYWGVNDGRYVLCFCAAWSCRHLRCLLYPL